MSNPPATIGGRYVLRRQIGQGGMGAVWLADDQVLGREVAVKRVGQFHDGTSPDLMRAQREAKLAAKLNHPHVVAVFDFVSERDEQWLVMEHVDGADLAVAGRALRRPAAGRGGGTARPRSPRRSPPRTRRASCTGTSSRPTCW